MKPELFRYGIGLIPQFRSHKVAHSLKCRSVSVLEVKSLRAFLGSINSMGAFIFTTGFHCMPWKAYEVGHIWGAVQKRKT